MSLSEADIEAKLKHFVAWEYRDGVIAKTFALKDFATAITFVNLVAAAAENAGHHPDMLVQYSKVTLSLTTHDSGGVTEADFAFAKTAEQIALSLF
jgi:4a-hydroxytetrahydrobiopterin dehydratase